MHVIRRSSPRSLLVRARSRGLYVGAASLLVTSLLLGCGDQFSVADASGSGGAAGTTTSDATATAATTAATGGGSATSSGTAGAGGEGGLGPAVEDCSNGIDDDGNTLTDCEDPACDAFLCTEVAPPGWSGPVAFYYGDPLMVPECDPIWPSSSTPGGGDLIEDPASCACSCETPQGSTCTLPPVTIHTDAACLAPIIVVNNAGDGVCAGLVNSTIVAGGIIAAPPSPSGGSCTPQADPNIPPAHWQFGGLICEGAPLGKGCDSGQVCAPKPAAPLSPGLCVYKSGTEDCPAGMYAFPTALYDSIQDGRSCSECTCDAPVKVDCSGVTTMFGDMACANEVNAFDHDGMCHVGAFSFKSYKYVQTGPSGGHCDPVGGDLKGTVSAGNALTVCCSF